MDIDYITGDKKQESDAKFEEFILGSEDKKKENLEKQKKFFDLV